MSMKSWVLHRVQGLGAVAGRGDLPARGAGHGRDPDLDSGRGGDARSGPATLSGPLGGPLAGAASEPALAGAEHLGAYAPLIGAVRDELEHFVASHVRLHVVIADRDRFVLTSLGVRSPGGASARDLLQQFMHEFRPEQVKRYLAREVIGRLPNAGVIDLGQFAGLADLEARDRAEEDGEYRELLAALRTAPPSASVRPYEISVLGRWTEADAPSSPSGRSPSSPVRGHSFDTPSTPLAGRRCEFDIDDGAGVRRATLPAVVPGRRYLIGKGAGCDLRIDGTYTSRRHAEIWLEQGSWFVADAGSTNGIRVERVAAGTAGEQAAPSEIAAGGPAPATGAGLRAATGDSQRIALGEGMRLVLSARAEGPPADYPWIALRPAAAASLPAAPTTPTTPIAARAGVPKTPTTEVLPLRSEGQAWFEIAATHEGGAPAFRVDPRALPLGIGRSRGQAIVIDRRHEGVSGHHVAIDEVDGGGVRGVVHGDNGVIVDGVQHAAGARFSWQPGQTLILGGALPGEPACSLALVRHGQGS